MTTTLFIKLAWLKTTTTIVNAKSSKTRVNQSMLYTVIAAHGLTKVPSLTRVSLTRKMELLNFVANQFHIEEKNLHSKK